MPTKSKDETPTPADNIQRAISIRNATGWRPEPNTLVTGTLVSIRKGESEFKSANFPEGIYPVFVYELPDGSFIALHAFHGMLYEKMKDIKAEHGIKLGDKHTIWYGGEKVSGTRTDNDGEPQKYNLYDVIYGDGTDVKLMDDNYTW